MRALSVGRAVLLLGLLAGLLVADEPGQGLEAALDALDQQQYKHARELAGKVIDAGNPPARAFQVRAMAAAALDEHAAAVTDCDAFLRLEPRRADVLDFRGGQQFMLAKFAESIADFDRAIELRPELARGHWQRGISCYYARRFAEGRRQFEGYQQFDDNDVENAVWRFLCMVPDEGLAKARQGMLKIKDDTRVPMREIYDLYAGQSTPEAVLAAAAAGDPTPAAANQRQFYAQLYLGLYSEVLSEKQQAQSHLTKAVEHKIPHYMWEVARVHKQLLEQKQPQP